jgi:hypothetical protein
MANAPMPTQVRLKEVFNYDPETGKVILLQSLGNYKAGTILKTKCGTGYFNLQIDKHRTLMHRFIWVYMYNRVPKILDHINGIRTDNRLINLREVSQRTNCQNRQHHRNGRLPGTSRAQTPGKWRAYYTIEGKQYNIGQFNSELDAHNAYVRQIKKLNIA